MALISTSVATAGSARIGAPGGPAYRSAAVKHATQNCPPSVYTECVVLVRGQPAEFDFDCVYCISSTWEASAVKAKRGLPTGKAAKGITNAFGGFCGNLCTRLTVTARKCKSSNGVVKYVDYVSAAGQGGPYNWIIGMSCQ